MNREREKEIFEHAKALPRGEREAYLKSVCPDERDRESVLELIRMDEAETLTLSIAGPELDTQVGKLRIIRKLGEGGMGIVFLAEHPVIKRKYAVKFLKPILATSEKAVAQFIEEAKKAAKLNHPAIVQVFDVQHDPERTYIVSEFVEGPTLTELMAQEGPQAKAETAGTRDRRAWVRRCTEIAAVIADALDCAHRNEIVHCDVKPSNILIDPLRGPRLTDFGIARYLGPSDQPNYTSTQLTPWYASPEQASERLNPIDARSDIFSLGVVLYELLAHRPFDGETISAVLESVRRHIPPMLRSENRAVPRDLETVCHKALEKSPHRRYPTAAHMAADLRCVLNDVRIPTSRPSFVRRRVEWARVHPRTTASVIVAVLLAIIISLAASKQRSERIAWEAARSKVTTTGVGADAVVWLRRFDTQSLEIGPRERLELRDDRPAWMLPGHYRCEIERPGHALAEIDVYIAAPGAPAALAPRWSMVAPTEGMVLVPGGVYTFGHQDNTPNAQERSVRVEPFWIDAFEVTNRQYMAFIQATSREQPRHWREFGYPEACPECPIVGIVRDDMQAYAQWAGKRLPTAIEWECAARRPDDRLLPWGDAPAPSFASPSPAHREKMLVTRWAEGREVYDDLARPVGSLPAARSALDLHFMFGNAEELTASIYESGGTAAQITKGGSWMDTPAWHLARNTSRPINAPSMVLGFRCARSAAATEAPARETPQ